MEISNFICGAAFCCDMIWRHRRFIKEIINYDTIRLLSVKCTHRLMSYDFLMIQGLRQWMGMGERKDPLFIGQKVWPIFIICGKQQGFFGRTLPVRILMFQMFECDRNRPVDSKPTIQFITRATWIFHRRVFSIIKSKLWHSMAVSVSYTAQDWWAT